MPHWKRGGVHTIVVKAAFLTPLWTNAYLAIARRSSDEKSRAGRPMTRHWLPEMRNQRQKGVRGGDEVSLQPSRRAHVDQLSHEESEIETASVNQQPLPNVGVASEVHTAHPAGLIKRRRGVPGARLVAAAAVCRVPRGCADDCDTPVACSGILRPVPSSAIRLQDVSTHAHGFEIHEGLIAVIALVADDLFDAVAIGPDGFDLLGGFNQRLDAGRRIAVVRILHRHADDRPSLEIDDMLGLVRQVRPAVLHLHNLRVGIMRMGPIVVRALLLSLPIDPSQIRPRRCLNPRPAHLHRTDQ